MIRLEPIRSRRLLDAARGQTCVRCGRDDGTVVAAHYTGLRQHLLGKGHGMKCVDLAIADLCQQCHEHMDRNLERKSMERSEEFLFLVLKTLMRRWSDGVLQ